jgi:HAE1 family hydrophobic/amphiphilic exporter-1
MIAMTRRSRYTARRRGTLVLLIGLSLGLATSRYAGAQPAPLPVPADSPVGSPMELTLEEAVRLALENSNDINVARAARDVATLDVAAAQGVWDPLFQPRAVTEHRVTPVASVIGGGANGSTEQNTMTGDLAVNGLMPWGGNYSVSFNSTRLTTDNQFVTINPQFPSSFAVNLRQPLLRGLTMDDNRRRLQIARRNVALSDAQFSRSATALVAGVERAYWDLVFALRSQEVQTRALDQARTQAESNRRQVAQGVLAPIDVVEADAQVAIFEQNLAQAQEAATRTETALKTLLASEWTSPLWSRPLQPTTPLEQATPAVVYEEAVRAALAARAELAEIAAAVEINDVSRRYFADLARPQIDLVGTYAVSGLAGRLAERDLSFFGEGNLGTGIPPVLIGGYGDSLRNAFNGRFPTVRVELAITLPFTNRTAKANVARTAVERRQLSLQRQQVEQLIAADVRNAIDAIRTGEARVRAAAAAQSLARQQYESEERRFQAGLTTLFLVLQRQTALVAAEGRELQARTDFNKAISDFRRVTATTLAAHGVDVVSAGQSTAPINDPR